MLDNLINKAKSTVCKTIKYEGDNQTFIWKHPDETFDMTSQLIVSESQEALFFKDGQALDLFTSGRYTLDENSIPLLGSFWNKVLGKVLDKNVPFNSEVYFINKVEQMAIKWGTDSKVEYLEPTFNFPIAIGACGEMSLRASDSKKMLLKLLGTGARLDQDSLKNYFKALLMTKVKSYIARFMKANSVNIFEIDSHLEEFSNELKKLLTDDFAEYGISLERFFVTTVVKPESDRQFMKFKELYFKQFADVAEATINQKVNLINAQTEAQKLIIDSQAQAQKRLQEGYTYQQERGFDIVEKVAANESIGQLSNEGTNIAAALNLTSSITKSFENTQKPNPEILPNSNFKQVFLPEIKSNPDNGDKRNILCPKCSTKLPSNAKFCLECGSKIELLADDEMICPKCGEKTKKGKFCFLCGAPLINKCSKCGTEVPPNGKFCLNCGEKLG